MKRLVFLSMIMVIMIMAGETSATPKFMTLPYNQDNVVLQQGWFYNYGDDPTHRGIDYQRSWQAFNVCASHDGQATYFNGCTDGDADCNGGLGNYVRIQKVIDGVSYYTLYCHLQSSSLTPGVPTNVARGQIIGMAGKTGAANNVIHLHFEYHEETIGNKKDPYDIYSTAANYPPNGGTCGNNSAWITCPPTMYTFIATQTGYSVTPDGPYTPGQTIQCQVYWRNDGTARWSNQSGSAYVELGSCNSSGTIVPSYLYASGLSPTWLSNLVPCTFNPGTQASIAPGQTATFSFQGKIPASAQPGQVPIYFGPVYNSQMINGWNGNGFTITVTSPPQPPQPLQPANPPFSDISTGRNCVSNIYEDPTYCVTPGYTANKLVDGNPQTLAYPASTYLDYQITFDGYDFIREFTIVFGEYGSAGYIDTWELWALNPDGTSWQQLHSGGCPNMSVFTAQICHPTKVFRIKAHSNTNWIGLYEVTVRGHHNSAVGLPVDQLTGGDQNYDKDPARLTDGNLATDAYPAATSFTYQVSYPQMMDISYITVVGKEYTNSSIYITNWSVVGFDGTNWVTLASGTTNPGNQKVIVGVFGKLYCIRVNCSSPSNWIGLYEVSAYGSVSQGSPKVMVEPDVGTRLPVSFSLSQNYPNPFNPATVISYSLPAATHVSLEVYNILGQKVATLVDERQEAGEYRLTFDCPQCASGIYLYRLATDQAVETKKMALLK